MHIFVTVIAENGQAMNGKCLWFLWSFILMFYSAHLWDNSGHHVVSGELQTIGGFQSGIVVVHIPWHSVNLLCPSVWTLKWFRWVLSAFQGFGNCVALLYISPEHEQAYFGGAPTTSIKYVRSWLTVKPNVDHNLSQIDGQIKIHVEPYYLIIIIWKCPD